MIISLKNSSSSAKINTLGAELVSFQREDGFELLWQGDPKHWSGQAPVLFPIVGALRNGQVKIEGDWYKMDRHGFVRKMEFAVEEQNDQRVALTISSGEATKKFYPYDFSFTVVYTLEQKGIKTEFIVKNTGEKTLPYAVGGHPGFQIPMGAGEQFEEYEIVFEKNETQRCPEIDLKECLIDFSKCTKEMQEERVIPLRHSLFYRDALVFEHLNSQRVKIVHPKSGRGVEMNFAGFPMLGIWSAANDAPFVALEPWTGCATTTQEGDEFAEKRNMLFLKPGDAAAHAFTAYYL